MEVSRSLLDCVSQEGLPIPTTGRRAGRLFIHQFRSFLEQFKCVCVCVRVCVRVCVCVCVCV